MVRKYIEGGKALIEKWTEFGDDIRKEHFDRLPTLSNFSTYTNNTITNTLKQLEKWDAECGSEIRQIIADILVEGSATGKWNHQIIKLVLTNTCNWGDGRKKEVKPKNVISEAEAEKAIKQYLKGNR